MKHIQSIAILVTLIAAISNAHSAPLASAITYQGRLSDAGSPASGSYDFQFVLYDAQAGGIPVGNTRTNEDLSVSNGLFTAEIDFGTNAFTGEARWLEISVRPGTNTGSFTALNPLQPITPTPYAQIGRAHV